MSKIRVDTISVRDFKRIERMDVDLKPITALVGGNTSGKSSILQAAQLGVSVLQASFQKVTKGGKAESLNTLANEWVSYRPTEYLLDLRHGEPATQNKGVHLYTEGSRWSRKGICAFGKGRQRKKCQPRP